MAVLSIGQVWADDEVVYTLTPVTGSDNGYASAEDIDITDGETTITWSVMGNSKDYAPWRIGGKGITNAIRPIYSKNAISDNITKVVVTHGAKTISSVSLKLYVYSTAAAAASGGSTNLISTVDGGTLAADDVKTFNRPTGHDWTGRFYRLEYSCTQSGSSNKYILFNKAEFYAEAAAPAYTITAQSNDESKGTVSLTGSVITGSPKSGCRYASPAYTVTSGTATVAQSGNAFTVTPSSDCTVRINFEAIPQYTVTWNNNGDENTTTQVYEGEKPVFPATPAACDASSTTFIGWATAPWDGKLANLSGKTVYTSADAMPAVNAAVTYYAVFAKSSGSAGNLFEWEGGTSSELTALENVTASGLGSDYAAGNAPYRVKFDTEGDYIVITTSGAIESVAVGVKMLGGGSTSHIYVQEAEDAESDFSAVETLTISGAQNDVLNLETENAFKADSRAVKLLFNKGSNVGVGPITIAGAASASDYMTTCCTKRAITIASGIENGTVSADPTSACEDATVTLTFTPAGGYHLDSWSVNGTEQDVAENTFTMPATAVTVSATFVHDDCTNLLAPTLDGVTKTYNSATIAWNTVTDAVAYAVSVVKDGESEPVFSGNVDALSKALENLEPETQYNYTIMAIGDGTVKCADGNGELVGNFTTEALPTAHLTLMNLGAEHASSGDYAILTPFNLPTTAAACSKAFVGWDADADCAVAPTYAKGESFQFNDENDVTLYAVYADVTGGGASSVEFNAETYAGANGWEDATAYTTFTINGVTFTATGGANDGKYYNSDKTWRLYNGGSLSISATGVTISSVSSNPSVSFAEDNGIFSCSFIATTKFKSITVNVAAPETYENYSTACIAAPEAIVDPEEVNAPAAGVANGVIVATYDNVNESAVAVALYSNAACTEAFTGSWLTASINGDKNIAYTIAENTSYNDARTAYIKLTAPETTGAIAPAVVIIPVSQAKKAAVFSSLEELVAADVNANTNVTVSFSNVVIKDIYYYNSNRRGLIFDIQKADADIKIYFNADVPAEWVAGGKVSGTLTDCPWKIYSGAWQLAPASGFVWATDLSYTAPKAVSSVVVSGTPDKTTYVDGEKFKPAGLTVTVNYTEGDPEVNPTGVTFACTPERVTKETTSVNVVATFNEVPSDAFAVTGFTVGDIPNKTIAEFITAGNADMRCYLEGTVSNYTNTTKGYFDLTDASGTIYIYGCDDPSSFAAGDKIKVIAEDYEYYNSKHEAKNVVFVSKVSAATIDIDDIDMTEGDELLLSDIVATITPDAAQSATINYEVTEGTAVTISEGKIIASTEGEATITASIAAGEGYLAGSTTFTVTVSPAPVPFVGDYFVKVDDNSKLTAGEYLIVYKDGSLAFNGGLEALDAASNTVAVTFENGKIQGKAEVLAATFTVKLAGGTIQSKSGYYIGRLGNSNGLNSSTEEAYTNTISIDENGDAVILASGGAYLRYNSASGQERFRYFKSDSYTGQKAIQLYKKENAEPVYETVRENLTANRYYTVCLPKKVTAIKGASFWTLKSKSQDGATAYLEEETNNLPFAAGKPFIIQATAEKLEVVYEGAATEDAGTNGALHGTLVYMDAAALAAAGPGVYMLFSNELRPVGENNHLDANRAYVKINELDAVPEAPQNAPGRRVVAMPMEKDVTTDINALNAAEAPVKMIIDGNLFILRGEKLYDATGRLVK